MAVKINKRICIRCENCAAICPTGAIRVEGGKACVAEAACIECCACMTDCPVEAITLPKEENNNGKS